MGVDCPTRYQWYVSIFGDEVMRAESPEQRFEFELTTLTYGELLIVKFKVAVLSHPAVFVVLNI